MIQFDKYNPIYNPIIAQCYIPQYCHKTWDIEKYTMHIIKPIKVKKIDCEERPRCIRPLFVLFLHYVISYLASNVIIKWSPPSDAYMCQWTGSAFVQIMACRLVSAKPLPEPMPAYCWLDSWEQISVKFKSEFYHFHWRKCIWKCPLRNGGHLVSASMC